MEKILQAADAKIPAKLTEQMPQNQTREKKSAENTTIGMRAVNEDVALVMKNDVSNAPAVENTSIVSTAPRNVVLLLIDERSTAERKMEEDPWNDCKKKLPFGVEGHLQVLFSSYKSSQSFVEH